MFPVPGTFKGNVGNHVAPALPGPGRFQEGAFTVEGPDPRGAEDLMPRKDEEIRVQGADVDRYVGNRLGAVNQHRNPLGMGDADQFRCGRDGSQGVGDLGGGYKTGAA